MTGEGLQLLTFARHLWPLSSEGSFIGATPTVTGHSNYNGHLRGPAVTLTLFLERLAVDLLLVLYVIRVIVEMKI